MKYEEPKNQHYLKLYENFSSYKEVTADSIPDQAEKERFENFTQDEISRIKSHIPSSLELSLGSSWIEDSVVDGEVVSREIRPINITSKIYINYKDEVEMIITKATGKISPASSLYTSDTDECYFVEVGTKVFKCLKLSGILDLLDDKLGMHM